MALLMYGAFRGDRTSGTVAWLAIGVSVVAALLVVAGPAGPRTAFNGMFVVDGFAIYAKILILAGAALSLVLAEPFNRREGITQFEFPILILFATLGLMMMVSASDLISFYLGLELQSLSLSVVAAIQRAPIRSPEAGLQT